MAIIRRSLVVIFLLAVVALAWLWWTRPVKVDMSAYVPADSIVYFEADSLPDILGGITSTDAWRELAPAAGVETNPGGSRRLSEIVSFTGMAPSDAVVLARAQVAVAVLGFEAAEEPDATLKLTPRAALVAETHTSEWRVKAAVEKLVGGFARRSLGPERVERKEVDGVQFVTWTAASGGRRKIVTAVSESVAVIGNDEAVVQACLDARRGARPSLAGSDELKEMRVRLGSDGALAFGFAPRGSAAKVVEVFAPAFVGGVAEDTHVQSVLATVLPQLINQTIGSAGWSARAVGGGIEDAYFLSLPGDMAGRLQAPLAAGMGTESGAEMLPRDVYQVSRYSFRSPEVAWRGLGAALSSQVDVSRATIITLALEALLKPYGVEQPKEFLRACGPEMWTARLEQASEQKMLVARVRDREALLQQARAYLGRGARTERVGDVEMMISSDAENGAASFVGDYLIMGAEADVRACLIARGEGRTLKNADAFKASAQGLFDESAQARTLTDERDFVRPVLSYFAGRGDSGPARANPSALEAALARRAYSVSETRLVEGGFEKKTRSSFGLFGEIVTRFAAR
ncbi:MAG: hypothetical protein H7Z38_03515 [Rubrivivax sp.]|nr:hypothetical protein [Pyrinomonadaceae bacterium]